MDRFLVERFVAEHAEAVRGATVRQAVGTADGLLLVLQAGPATVELGWALLPGAALVWWLGPEARAGILAELARVAPAWSTPLESSLAAPPGTTALDALRAWLVRPGPRSGEWSRLHGARLETLAVQDGDRILELRCTLAAESATPQAAVLHAELFDPAGNLLLLASDGALLASWRRRSVKPPRARPMPASLDVPALARALGSERALRALRPDLGPLEARAALSAAAGDAASLGAWLARRDAAPDALALDWTAAGLAARLAPPASGLALATATLLAASIPAAAALRVQEARAVRRRVERLERLVEELERDAEDARAAAARREEAELLTANLHALRRGQKAVTVENLFAAGEPRTIALDPALTPQENVARLYKEARRAARAHEPIAARLASARQELAEARAAGPMPADADWRTALQHGFAAWRAACPAALRAAPAALWRPGGLPVTAPGKPLPTTAESRGTGPGRCFLLGDKWEVRVGRTNEENDLLTHRFASPDDIWLHASGVPGSHVILRMQGRTANPPREILEAAAAIAARFSKAKHAGTVPVLWTRKRYVRKPRGAKPGLAACTHESTLFVRPGLPAGSPTD